ncbi:SMC-Scp complex subunit ScpB [Paludifilum halophilum]|uniref:Segregation and condensation protein B n=1 Tax=Paludifilum halophilum TaxID=1642702 RepID=A0A235BCI7_9BACL|nr:SMC-Scp complex subunit ScpB [Paludifilum halophilum]
MEREQWKPVIEGLLFAAGEDGLSLNEMTEVTGLYKPVVSQILQEMKEEWKEQGRGLQIVEVAQVYQLTTLSEHQEYFEKLAQSPNRSRLSRAALETLAIIAYRQPIIRADLEEIRGVKSERTIYYLKRKGLIREVGRAEGVGRPILYGTSREFLDYFGLKSLEELPSVDTIFDWAELEQERQELYQRLGVDPAAEGAAEESVAPAEETAESDGEAESPV